MHQYSNCVSELGQGNKGIGSNNAMHVSGQTVTHQAVQTMRGAMSVSQAMQAIEEYNVFGMSETVQALQAPQLIHATASAALPYTADTQYTTHHPMATNREVDVSSAIAFGHLRVNRDRGEWHARGDKQKMTQGLWGV